MHLLRTRRLSLAVIFFTAAIPAAAIANGDQQIEVVCPRADGAITLDGKLDEPAWENAAALAPLLTLETKRKPDEDITTARLLHNDEALYLRVTCQAAELKAVPKTPRDGGAVWRNPHLEVFLDPTPDSPNYFHLVIDCGGNVWDGEQQLGGTDAKGAAWNGDWTAAVVARADGWTCELAIPFSALGATAPKPGDLWRLKVCRDAGHDGPLMWPPSFGRSFHDRDADGALYFDTQNLLVNGDFEDAQVAQGAPDPWGVSLTSSEVHNEPQGEVHTVEGGLAPGKHALLFKKLATALWWPQVWNHGYKLAPGGTYEFSIMVMGTMAQVNLRATAIVEGQPVKMSHGVNPTNEFTRLKIAFVVPEGATSVAVGLSAPAATPGQVLYDNAILRRVLRAEDAMEHKYYPPDWSPPPDPIHGLEALLARAGHKPWDLYQRDGGLLTCRVMFKDRKYGTDLWMLDNSPSTQYVVTASIWPGWNADCSVMMLPGRRTAGGEAPKRWLCDAEFSRLVPQPAGGMPLWDLENPDVYYAHSQGKVEKINFRTGEQKVLAEWEPRGTERSYGLTKDNKCVWVADWDGGEWLPYKPGDTPLPQVKVLDCYGPDPDRDGRFASQLIAADTESGPKFRVTIGTRVYTDTGRAERVILPISGRKEYLETFVSGRVQFPDHAALPDTKDLDELFELYHLTPSCSHGHLSYSPDSEYTCWDGSPSFYRTRDGGDSHSVQISPNGWCYHVCWFYNPRFFVTGVRPYRTNYDRPINGNLLSQVFTDGTWQPICDMKIRPNAFYYGGNFATFSRDATKVHYASSMTGGFKNYIAVMARPQPPRDIAAKADGNAVVLSWSPAPHHTEIKGALVYRSDHSGDGYTLLTPEPVAGGTYRDQTVRAGEVYYYVLTSLEHCGLESGYSAEARAGVALPEEINEPLVIYLEAEDTLADLASGDKPGLSVGRDRIGASNWCFAYLTPGAKEGKAGTQFYAPAGADYYVWVRARRSNAGTDGWHVEIDGKSAGRVSASDEQWTWWQTSQGSVSLAAGHRELTLSTTDRGAQADLICLATDPDFEPQGMRPEDRDPPAAVGGLRASSVRDRVIQLSWDAGAEADLSHYNVYASREPITAPNQEFLLASPTYPEFIDWGLRAATTYRYAVTAVDRRGNEGPLGAVAQAKTPDAPQPRHDIELAFDQATLEGPFERADGPGTRAKQYVILPAKLKPEQVAGATATWQVEVPNDAKYCFWLRYLPRGAASSRGAAVSQNISVLLDGKTVASIGGGLTDLSVPDSVIRPEFWTWARPVSTDLIAVELSAGKHELRLEKLTLGIRYDLLLITNEPSFLPTDGRLKQR